MTVWLAENLINIVICLVLALVVFLAIRKMFRNRKSGKSVCGCDCGSCGACCTDKTFL